MLTDRINSRLAWSYLSNCELHHRITYEYMVQSPPQEDLDPSSFSRDLASKKHNQRDTSMVDLSISPILRILAFLLSTILHVSFPVYTNCPVFPDSVDSHTLGTKRENLVPSSPQVKGPENVTVGGLAWLTMDRR